MRPHPRLLNARVMLTVEPCKQQQHYNENNIFPIAAWPRRVFFALSVYCAVRSRLHRSLLHEKNTQINKK